jgi:hypothetical protein
VADGQSNKLIEAQHTLQIDPNLKRIRLELLILELNCKQNKDRHFSAAERKRLAHTSLGLGAALLAAIVASQSLEHLAIPRPWIVPVLSLVVAGLTAALSFLKLDQQITVHYTVGNKYVSLRSDARRAFHATVRFTIDTEALAKTLEKLAKRYDEINVQSAAAPTSWLDRRRARRQNDRKWQNLRKRLEEADDELIGRNPAGYEMNQSLE